MNNYYESFNKKFAQRFIVWSSIYTVIMILAFFLFKLTLSRRTYFGYENMYPFYNWANHNKVFLIFIVLSFGYAYIAFILFKRATKYMDEIVGAIDEIYKDDDLLISLSSDLKEVNEKMNNIKFSLRENEKLAKDAEKRKSDLIIYLAHDLKTPLTSIIGYLNILKDEDDLSEDFRKKYLKISHDKTLRLEELINEFFEITRYNLKDISLEKSNVDFSLMMEQIIYEFNPLLIEKKLSIKSNIESSIKLSIDPNKIERVIDNIVRNAINYSYENGEISISVYKENDFVYIDILNKGATIPKEKIDYIFDEFYRIDYSRSTKTGGAGLGLAIAKSIITAHGGTIEAESENETVEMKVKLPI